MRDRHNSGLDVFVKYECDVRKWFEGLHHVVDLNISSEVEAEPYVQKILHELRENYDIRDILCDAWDRALDMALLEVTVELEGEREHS